MSISSSSSATLVLVSTLGMGHLVPAMELAKLLVPRDTLLTITVLLIKPPVIDERLDSYTLSIKTDPSLLQIGVTLIDISVQEPVIHKPGCMTHYTEIYKSIVKDVVERLRFAGPVGGLVLDSFCSAMFGVADELRIPSYLFFTSGASLLTMMFHLRGIGVDLSKEYDVVQSLDTTVDFPGFRNPVHVGVWPGFFLLEHDGSGGFFRHIDTYRKAKGILVNTFTELERDLIHSISQDDRIPPVFPVGPLLNLLSDDDDEKSSSVMRWLDVQPPRSVVFLCFGSRGSFNDTQVKEIAYGLERSGRRFLWSLQIRPGVLPEGFLERTTSHERVVGWAPQVRVLGHEAIEAFVSHCGWNSTLESLWYNIPMIAWPISAEQQLNALRRGIRKSTESDSTKVVRKKVKEMSEEAKKAVKEGGSSYEYVGKFIESVFDCLHKIS